MAKRSVMIARERNFVPKIICMTLSVVLWAFVSSSKSETIRFKVPVEIRNLPTYLTVSQMSTTQVSVILDGKKDSLRTFNTKQVRAFVDLQRPKIGEIKKYPVLITRQMIPESVSVTLSPPEIDIRAERIDEKWVRVLPRITGDFRQGYMLGRVRVMPEKVMISGPQSLLEKIDFIYSDDVNITGLTGEVVKQVDLKSADGEAVALSETNVKVSVQIIEQANVYEVRSPLVIKNPDKNCIYNPGVADVIVFFRGQKKKVAQGDVEAFIDVATAGIKALFDKTGKKVIEKDIPVSVQLKNGDEADTVFVYPEKVTVKITRK